MELEGKDCCWVHMWDTPRLLRRKGRFWRDAFPRWDLSSIRLTAIPHYKFRLVTWRDVGNSWITCTLNKVPFSLASIHFWPLTLRPNVNSFKMIVFKILPILRAHLKCYLVHEAFLDCLNAKCFLSPEFTWPFLFALWFPLPYFVMEPFVWISGHSDFQVAKSHGHF